MTGTAPRIVDLFAGPGGLDVAAHWLGIPTVGIEWDAGACATRRAAGLATVQGDVRAFGPGDVPDATVLAGGPPCQTYTVAGTGAGRNALDDVLRFVKRMGAGDDVRADLADLDDERTGLVLEPLRWILEAHRADRPYRAVVLEQVPAVLPVWFAYREVLAGLGYRAPEPAVLRTEEYGVPQTRRRALLVAHLDREPALPAPTHRPFRKGTRRDSGGAAAPWVSMGDALDRDGPFAVVSNYGTGGDPRARGRRTSDEPAFTVTGKVSRNRLEYPDGRDRGRLSLAEAGVLQTFPVDYPWSGRDVSQQVGNAIPPRLATHVLAAALGTGPVDDGFFAARRRWSVPRTH